MSIWRPSAGKGLHSSPAHRQARHASGMTVRHCANLSGLLIVAAALASSLLRTTSLFESFRGVSRPSTSSLDAWIETERPIAWHAIMANIGPAAGAADGLVIASPSIGEYEDEPDYYYTWTRDSALTYSAIFASFLPLPYLDPRSPPAQYEPSARPELEALARAYVTSQANIQLVQTPSGNLQTGGLGEPKYHVDGTAFTGSWGRPQRDGPALRALTLIPYAHYLLDRAYPADIDYVQTHLYNAYAVRRAGSVIKNDLEEIAGSWRRSGFDLWEEVDGMHLFTLLSSLRALQAGETLATRLNDTHAADFYATQAAAMASNLTIFFDTANLFWRASITKDQFAQDRHDDGIIGARLRRERTGLDCAFALTTIHAGARNRSLAVAEPDIADGEILAPGDSDVLKTLHDYVATFAGLYGVNKGKWTDGWAVGRYAEDVYNGVGTGKGNPWFICTFSVAHVLYLAQSAFMAAAQIDVDELSAAFWSDVLGHEVHAGTRWAAKSTSGWPACLLTPSPLGRWMSRGPFEHAVSRLGEVADAWIEVGRRWATAQGRMSEQIDRSDGSQTGARDLTWSYASFLEAARAREAVKRRSAPANMH